MDELETLRSFKAEATELAQNAVSAIEAVLNRGEENLSADELADALVDALIALEAIAGSDLFSDEDDGEVWLLMGRGVEDDEA